MSLVYVRAGKYFSKEAKCFRSWLAVLGFDKCWLEKKRTPKSSEQICFQGGQTNCNLFFSYRRWSPSSKEGDLHLLPLLKLLASQNTIPGRDNTSLTPFFSPLLCLCRLKQSCFSNSLSSVKDNLFMDRSERSLSMCTCHLHYRTVKKKKKHYSPLSSWLQKSQASCAILSELSKLFSYQMHRCRLNIKSTVGSGMRSWTEVP